MTFDPLSPALDDGVRSNADRKNWNSIGDHIPAYLINLFLATGEEQYADELESLCDQITDALPGLRQQPVRAGEVLRRLEPRPDYGSQHDRAIVGHNLKIAWNLTRMNSLRPKAEYVASRRRSPTLMPASAWTPSAAAGTT